MTEDYVDKWMKDRAHLRLQTAEDPGENPDSRVFDDINQMTGDVITLGSGFLTAAVTFPAFSVVLWNLSGTLNFNVAGHAVNIPGFLMFGAIAYAAIGTWAARKVGKPLIGMHFNQKKYENRFRSNADHVRINSESIALYNGEEAEKRALKGRIQKITDNWHRINGRETRLTVIRDTYNRIGYVMPYSLMLPNVFKGATKWGDLAQAAHAMGQVQSALSWLFYSYSAIARIQASVSRIDTFNIAVDKAQKTELSRYPDRSGGGVQLELGL
jgi:putative ATP-binding cassette transporter